MQVEEVVTRTYKLSLSEEDYKRLRNHFYPILKQAVKDKFTSETHPQSVCWFDLDRSWRRLPDHPLHSIFQSLDLYTALDSEAFALHIY